MSHEWALSSAGSQQSLSPDYNSPRNSALVLPVNRAEFEDLYTQAKSFINRAEFKNASILCSRAKNLLPPPALGEVSADRLQIQMQMDIITLLSGSFNKYSEAAESLKTLKEDYKKLDTTQRRIRIELNRWLAESFTLQGEYARAVTEFEDLPGLNKKTQKLVIPASVKLEEEDITAFRDLALTFAYLGFLTRAQTIIRMQAQRQMSAEKGREPETSGTLVVTVKLGRAGALENKRDSVIFAGAVIYTLSGNYVRAVRMAEEAWQGRKARLGGSHVKTLESASLWAHLLALTSRTREAENVCIQTLKTLSATELGPRHPQTIRTMKTLVFILRTQFRLVEAVDTGYSLCKIATDTMTDSHPETLKARAELASALRSAGDYEAAETTYADVVSKSQIAYKGDPEHPQTLQYQSELAHVYACIGRLEEAETLGLKVAWKQRHAYQFEKSKTRDQGTNEASEEGVADNEEVNVSLEKPKMSEAVHQSGEERLAIILDDLETEYLLDEALGRLHAAHTAKDALPWTEKKIGYLERAFITNFTKTQAAEDRVHQAYSMEGMQRIWQEFARTKDTERARDKLRSLLSELRVHPSLLHTMQILGWVKLQKQDADIDLTCRIIDIVLKWRRKTLGEYHDLTLVSEYDLAVAKRERGSLDEARIGFQTVFSERRTRLGESHPDTLVAKREFIVTCSAMGRWEDPDASSPSLHREQSSGLTEPFVSDGTPIDETEAEGGQSETVNTPPVSEDMTLDDWTAVERISMTIAVEQESRAGADHPETINTLLWVFAVQILTGKIREASQTMSDILERLYHSKVQEQRLLNTLLMEERIARICLEQNLPGYAMDVLNDIKNRIEKSLPTNQKIISELRNLRHQCDEGVGQICDGKDESAELLLISATSEEPEDAEVYLINILRLAYWTVLDDKHETVQKARSMTTERCSHLITKARGTSGDKADNLLAREVALLKALFPERAEEIAKFRFNANKLLRQKRGLGIASSPKARKPNHIQETMEPGIKESGPETPDEDEWGIIGLWVESLLKHVDTTA